jgi:hypothetical protein
MTRNSRRPVRRLTESQLRRIIRQEVRRLNESEHTAMGPGGADDLDADVDDIMAAYHSGEDSAEIAREMIRNKRRLVPELIRRISDRDPVVASDIQFMLMGQLGMG